MPRFLTVLRFAALLFPLPCLAQTDLRSDTTVYVIVETLPTFPGGMDSLRTYLSSRVRYPEAAAKARVKGRVWVSFVVGKTGLIREVAIKEGLGYGCDQEALRLVQSMPPWQAGSQSGIPLIVRHTIPVFFGLDYRTYPKIKYR